MESLIKSVGFKAEADCLSIVLLWGSHASKSATKLPPKWPFFAHNCAHEDSNYLFWHLWNIFFLAEHMNYFRIPISEWTEPKLYISNVFCDCTSHLYFTTVFLLDYIPAGQLGGQLNPVEPLQFHNFLLNCCILQQYFSIVFVKYILQVYFSSVFFAWLDTFQPWSWVGNWILKSHLSFTISSWIAVFCIWYFSNVFCKYIFQVYLFCLVGYIPVVELGGQLDLELYFSLIFCNCILQLYFPSIFLLGYIPVVELGGQLDPEEPLEFFHFLRKIRKCREISLRRSQSKYQRNSITVGLINTHSLRLTSNTEHWLCSYCTTHHLNKN